MSLFTLCECAVFVRWRRGKHTEHPQAHRVHMCRSEDSLQESLLSCGIQGSNAGCKLLYPSNLLTSPPQWFWPGDKLLFFFFNCLAKIFLNHRGVPSVPPSKKIQGRTLVICSSIYLSTGIVASLWLLFTFKRCQFLDIFPDKALCLRVLYTWKYIFYSENLEYSKHNKNYFYLISLHSVVKFELLYAVQSDV